DALGDMDFKVTGTREGVTAIQMDIKVAGLTEEILKNALTQAREGRMFILDKMDAVISEPRAEVSVFAPRITTIKINPDKIRDIIGPGGKVIRKITEETKTSIDIQDDGSVNIGSSNAENTQKAIDWIRSLTREVEAGEIYTGKVTRIPIRRLRRDPAGQGRPRPYLGAGELPRAHGRGRGQYRRRDPGAGHRDRPSGSRESVAAGAARAGRGRSRR